MRDDDGKERSMRSKEVADLAGVTVRTLRHYHQLGILPEPPRRENGYREYGVADVVRVLRIKRLASLGLSLERVGEMIGEDVSRRKACSDGGPCAAGRVLDELDAELAAQIARLEERRRVIARLKEELPAGSAPLDVSPRIESHIARLVEYGASAKMAGMELDLMLLVDEHEAGSEAMDDILAFYAFMEERGVMPRYIELSEEALALPPHASEDVCESLAGRISGLLIPVLSDFVGASGGADAAAGEGVESYAMLERLLFDYDGEVLNPAQRRMEAGVISRIREGLKPASGFHFDVDYDATS